MKILLGNLKDKAAELVTFLEPRLGTKAKVSGSELEIEDDSVRKGVKPRHVKTYVKRYLFQTGQRKAFRVLVQGRELSLVELEVEEEEEEPSKTQESKEEKKEEREKKEEAEEKPVEEEVVEESEEKAAAEENKEETKKKPRKKKEANESG